MCWVMPPCSPPATSAWRRASSSEVLPWSTWPMTATTGARTSRLSSMSSAPRKPSSTSESETRLTVWPNSVAISSAVSLSITSLIFTIMPWRIRNLMTSTPRVAIRLDSSATVITSGITTSRATRACSWTPPLRFSRSRSRARRTEARERIRSTAPSSSPATAWMVRRPSRRWVAPLARLMGLLAAPAALRRVSSSSSARRSRVWEPGRGAWRVARWISGVAGAAAGARRGWRGPPGRAPSRAPGAGRGERAE